MHQISYRNSTENRILEDKMIEVLREVRENLQVVNETLHEGIENEKKRKYRKERGSCKKIRIDWEERS